MSATCKRKILIFCHPQISTAAPINKSWSLLATNTKKNKQIKLMNFCFEALALKGIDYETHPVHLLKDGGQQVSACWQLLIKLDELNIYGLMQVRNMQSINRCRPIFLYIMNTSHLHCTAS